MASTLLAGEIQTRLHARAASASVPFANSSAWHQTGSFAPSAAEHAADLGRARRGRCAPSRGERARPGRPRARLPRRRDRGARPPERDRRTTRSSPTSPRRPDLACSGTPSERSSTAIEGPEWGSLRSPSAFAEAVRGRPSQPPGRTHCRRETRRTQRQATSLMSARLAGRPGGRRSRRTARAPPATRASTRCFTYAGYVPSGNRSTMSP